MDSAPNLGDLHTLIRADAPWIEQSPMTLSKFYGLDEKAVPGSRCTAGKQGLLRDAISI